jgi:CRISPR/Cas system CMR subunit Cmr4 (Cas7 group RAMP superfamily)
MDPLTIGAIIVAFKVITLVAVLVLLTYQYIIDWFQENEALVQSDIDNIAVTLKELYHAGDYKVVQGVFNTRTNEVVAGRKIHSQNIDEKLDEKHRDNQLVIYQ